VLRLARHGNEDMDQGDDGETLRFADAAVAWPREEAQSRCEATKRSSVFITIAPKARKDQGPGAVISIIRCIRSVLGCVLEDTKHAMGLLTRSRQLNASSRLV
jgi:hypothetical protein